MIKLNKTTIRFFEEVKLIIKCMLIGFTVIIALGVGLLVMIWGALFLPVLYWIKQRIPEKYRKEGGNYSKNPKGKVIDAEYEVINDD